MDGQKWAEFYRSNPANTKYIFVKVMTDDGEHFFFHEKEGWFDVKNHCGKNSVFIQDLHLQFRSNRCIIDVEGCDAVYLVPSCGGAIGQETRHFFTVGLLKGGELTKHMYAVPELIKEKEYLDTLNNCFDEAVIYNEKTQANKQKQVQT